jgi:hypothetical protein
MISLFLAKLKRFNISITFLLENRNLGAHKTKFSATRETQLNFVSYKALSILIVYADFLILPQDAEAYNIEVF